MNHQRLGLKKACYVFGAFGLAYFVSTLVRAITATLSPSLSLELSLHARELGLLAGGFSLGFALVQLPMGGWLDRFGPKRVSLVLMCIAMLGCIGFAKASNFYELWGARIITGVGVSACLMAPLTGGRRWLEPSMQLRVNSWLLMTGSLGMLMSTVPVQLLLPVAGWRTIFLGVAGVLLVAVIMIGIWVPDWEKSTPALSGAPDEEGPQGFWGAYAIIFRAPYFRKTAPIGFFGYGSLLAIQTLWAGPWMSQMDHLSAMQTAQGLFILNLSMLICFGCWGWFLPKLQLRGWTVDQLMRWIYPVCLVFLVTLTLAPQGMSVYQLTLYCLASSVIAMVQPTVGMAFEGHLAGKALCSYNLVIFLGIFVVQWGLGLCIDWGVSQGFSIESSYKLAFMVDFVLCAFSYLYFLVAKGDNRVVHSVK
jgi:MFS family permease